MTGLAFSTQTLLAFAVLALVLIAVGVWTARGMRGREPSPDVPPAMGPGPSDADLERPLLEKLQGWALLLFVFFAIWIPIYWLREPTQNINDELAANRESIERGHLTTEEFEEGVNEFGFGCVRCHGPELRGGQNFFQGQYVTVPGLQDVCARLTLGQVYDTIAQGREGTDMPSWSVRFAGPLNDQQINDIVAYIVSIQDMPPEENRCLNPEQEGS